MRFPLFEVRPAPTGFVKITQFSGLNIASTNTQIGDNESPDMLNIALDAQLQIDKRFGYERIYPTSLGAGAINGMHEFVKIDGSIIFLVHWGTGLYTQSGNAQPVQISNALANARSHFFTFNNKVYILDGTNYLQYDGTTVVDVSTVAYIPTLFISTPPAGGGTANENANLLTPAFKQSFSGNASATVYQLAVLGLDASPPVTALVNGATITEGSGLTVNRATGTITFIVAPSTGTNNVIITAYKTLAGNAARIKTCKDFCIYGGDNDTRVFLYGNPTLPNYLFRSGLYDPTYFGDLAFQKVGSDANRIQKMIVQYDTAVILKSFQPNDTMIWNLSYTNNGLGLSNSVTFPIRPINAQIGCTAGDSVQLINNAPTWLSQKGVHSLTGSNVKDERNTEHISNNVDFAADTLLTGLMQELQLSRAVSVDYDYKYILTVGDVNSTRGLQTWVLDYRVGAWLRWDNIKASCYYIRSDQSLVFGDALTGRVYRFKKQNESAAYSDNGTAINAYWKSKVFGFNDEEHLKTVTKVWFALKPNDSASASYSYQSDNFMSGVINVGTVDLFDYSTWDYSTFTYLLSSYPNIQMVKVHAKKVVYFQNILSNNLDDSSMGILSLSMKVQTVREAK